MDVESFQDAPTIREALEKVVDAWEALPGGRNHRPRVVERWLAEHMSPAINVARRSLGRSPPHGP